MPDHARDPATHHTSGPAAKPNNDQAEVGAPQWARTGDGRRIAFAEFGDPTGRPLIYCHGFPSSRREARLLAVAAMAEGARVIAPDRPGYGDSEHAPNRTLTGWAEDCLALADHLGLARFGLIGVSGGGPYALACAWRLPQIAPGRLVACTLVGPLGPIYQASLLEQMQPAARFALGIARATPTLAHALYGGPTAATMEHWPKLVEWVRHVAAPAVDREVLGEGDNNAILNSTICDAMARGAPGARRDLVLYTHDWQLPFPEIALPVRIWHGDADLTVPVEHGRWYAANLPQAHLHELPGEGHYSLPIRHAGAIIRQALVDFDARP